MQELPAAPLLQSRITSTLLPSSLFSQPSIMWPRHRSSLMMMKLRTRQRSQRGIGSAARVRACARRASNGSGVKQQVCAPAAQSG